jgi:hypothetical protein
MNPFIAILKTRGFTEGASGRWFDPDSKYNDGVWVEVSDTLATVESGRLVKTFPMTPEGVQDFRTVV